MGGSHYVQRRKKPLYKAGFGHSPLSALALGRVDNWLKTARQTALDLTAQKTQKPTHNKATVLQIKKKVAIPPSTIKNTSLTGGFDCLQTGIHLMDFLAVIQARESRTNSITCEG